MSKFSDLLTTYIEENGIKIYSLAQYCKIDRSAVYRFMNGSRIPSEKSIVQQIADYLKLTSHQKAKFLEAWEISTTGEELWYQRKAVEHFLLNLQKTDTTLKKHLWNFSETILPAAKSAVVLNGKEKIEIFLETMLIRESASKNPKLMLLLQPELTDLVNLLLGDPRSKNFDIYNIVCLNNHKPSDTQSFSCYNIECFKKLMPLYINHQNFCSQYYYDNVTMHFHSINLLPCMILTGSSAIICSANLSFGIAHTDPAIVAILQEIFQKYKASSRPLVTKNSWNTQEFKKHFFHFSSQDSILFGPEPYICSWLTPEVLQKYLTEESIQNKEILSASSFYLSTWKTYMDTSKITWYTTRSNLEYFMATGQITSLPKGIIHPLSFHDRHIYLEYLYDQIKNHPIHLISGPLEHIKTNYHLYINAQTVFFTFPENHHSISSLTVSEPSLISSFSDLFTYLKASNQFAQQKFYKYIKNML